VGNVVEYATPQVEVIEVEVEKGFAGSFGDGEGNTGDVNTGA